MEPRGITDDREAQSGNLSVSGEGGAVPVSSTKTGSGGRDDTRQDVICFQDASVF
jgi:hypothetical protein